MGLFGPSKREVWQQLSKEIHGEYIEGGVFKNAKVKAHVDNWTILLDTYTVSSGKSSTTYTRIRAPFKNTDDLFFKIYKAGFFSDIGKIFGMQDIKTGYEQFDNDFIIQGNNVDKVKYMFSNYKIRDLIDRQPKMSLEIKDSEGFFSAPFPEDVNELYFKVLGVIRDVDRLKELFVLFTEVLNTLCEMGSAERSKPDVEL